MLPWKLARGTLEYFSNEAWPCMSYAWPCMSYTSVYVYISLNLKYRTNISKSIF